METPKKKTPPPLARWKVEFLGRRGFSQPTGQPLYSYRMTSAEFEELERMLKEMLSALLPAASLGVIASQLFFFPSLFVIYAAEWWRRRYDGSGWSWEPIVEDLGAPSDGWNETQRSECVEKGLREWHLQLSNLHGLRFLGSVAFQGGLPMQLLASARGSVGRVLRSVLRLAAAGNVEANDILGWIRSLSGYLPRAYGQNEIHVLLAEVILTVLRLKQEANLTSAAGAVDALNQFEPEWRARFPIPVEDTQAQGLIEQLIQDAAAPPVVRRNRKIVVERTLELLENGTWQLRSDIDLVEYIDAAELASMFSAEVTSLTRWLTLRLIRGNHSVEVGMRRLAGQERYRIDRRPLDCRVSAAIAEHTMTLMSPEGQTWNSAVARGEALNPDLPWIFEPIGGAAQSFRLVRQGSGAVGSTEARLLIPANWRLLPEQDCEVSQVGTSASGGRSVWSLKGNLRLTDPEGRQFRIRCGQADSREEDLEWRGARVWELASQPELAFRGVPKLYRISEEGLPQPAGSISWHVKGAGSTRTPIGLVGPVDAIWPAEGDTKWKSRLVLLPDEARYQLVPGETPAKGQIRFLNWGLVSAQMEDAAVSVSVRREGAQLLVDMEYRGSGTPPEWCDVKFYWPKNPSEARFRVPFPAKGARAFDASGKVIAEGSLMTIRNTLGIRLVAFLGDSYRADLHLDLHRSTGSALISSMRKPIRINPGEHRVEVRLVDHHEDILRLLSDADSLDAVVTVRLQVGSNYVTSLRIARYACELVKQSAGGAVALPSEIAAQLPVDQARALPIRAVRIDAPGEEPIVLATTDTQEAVPASWIFPEQDLGPGPWLIYPGSESGVAFRPLLWTVERQVADPAQIPTPLGSLVQSLRVVETELRNSWLDSGIRALAGNFLHEDWLLVEQLAGHLGHLPLSTLDLWRRFARSPEGMAALAVRMGSLPSGFVERFANELPFLWETVSIRAWVNAITSLRTQCESWYGSEANRMVGAHLDRRIQDMASSTPSLRILMESAAAFVTGKANSDLQVARQAFMGSIFAGQLFEGANCRLQHLMRNNFEATWPQSFTSQINAARRDRRSPYLCPTSFGFRDAVINVPILLALGAVMDVPPDWRLEVGGVGALRAFQRFDPEWFAEAFDLTVARCLATNVIQFQ